MSQELDAKKNVIMPLLDKLRRYNTEIGSYDKSVMNSNFNYSVKLSNGRIEIAEELVYDFENNPLTISEERYNAAAKKYESNSIPISQKQETSTTPTVLTQEQNIKKKKKSPLISVVLAVLVTIGTITFFANQSSSNAANEISEAPSPIIEKSPEELRQELLLTEQQSPTSYLQSQATMRENLIGETVLEGTISNSSTLANFKDIVLNVTWLSKTDTELKTDQFSVYEFIEAGKSVSFKIKTYAPSATDRVKIEVFSATPVN